MHGSVLLRKMGLEKHVLCNTHLNPFLARLSPQAAHNWKKRIFTGQLDTELVIYSIAQAVASLPNLIKDLFLQKIRSRKQDGEGTFFRADQTGELLVGACSGLTQRGMNGGQRKGVRKSLRGERK